MNIQENIYFILDHKINSPVITDYCYQMVIWQNPLLCLKMFLFFRTQKRHPWGDITPFLKTSKVTIPFQGANTNAGSCGYSNAISKKHFRYSRFVKRIIAIEAQLYFLDLVGL